MHKPSVIVQVGGQPKSIVKASFSQTEMCISSSNKQVNLPVVNTVLIMIEVTAVELSRHYSCWKEGRGGSEIGIGICTSESKNMSENKTQPQVDLGEEAPELLRKEKSIRCNVDEEALMSGK